MPAAHAASGYARRSDARRREKRNLYEKPPGEILSYLIVTSRTFRSWFEDYVVKGCRANLNLETIAKLILVEHDDKEKYFLANIISGAYDCDKLDYVARDSYFCGLALTVDLSRFYSMISTARI